MKEIGTTLVIITVFLFFPKTSLQILGIIFTSPTNITWLLKLFLLLLSGAITFIIYEKIIEEQIINQGLRLFSNKIRKYMERRNGKKIKDLKTLYPQIGRDKDIYYIEGNLVLKTTDITNDGNYEPEGYILKISKAEFYCLVFINGMKTTLTLDVLPYALFQLWSLFLFIILLIEFYFHLHGWL